MSQDDYRQASEIAVPSTDPEKKDGDKPKANGNGKLKDEKDEPEISEEDLQLKAELEMLVERFKESDTGLYLPALESLRTLIRTSTSSMTSVPKPLKFLRPHYDDLGKIRRSWSKDLSDQRALLASILSVLAMTYSDTGKRDTLYYRLISGTHESPGSWGHEYVRHLAAELGEEYNTRFTDDEASATNGNGKEAVNGDGEVKDEGEESREYAVEDLRKLSMELVEFFLKHNAEADAVDLLLEVEDIRSIVDKVDDKTWPRVCQYMVSCVPLLVPPDDREFLETAAEVYAKHDRYPEALALAVRLNSEQLVRKYYSAPTNRVMQMQLSHFLARAGIPLQWVHAAEDAEPPSDGSTLPPTQDEDILNALTHTSLSQYFRKFGEAAGVAEPRSVEDVYKVHLEDSSRGGSAQATIDSARQNLAATFVNAFVNAGFGNDKLLVDAPEGASWVYKNRDVGMTSATASIGMSMLWDPENGANLIDKYSYSSEETIKAGAIMATGIVYAGMRAEPDIAWALLEEYVESQSIPLKIAAFNGLAVSHAGWYREEMTAAMLPYVADETNEMQVAAMASLALGFVFVGSGDGEIASTILQALMERETHQLESEWSIFMIAGLALIFIGTQDAADATVETLHAIEHPIARSAEVLVDACAYAGTGNVLKIQKMLQICSEHRETKSKKPEEADGEAAPAAAPTDAATDGSANANAAEPATPGGYAQVPTDEPMEDASAAAEEGKAEVDMRKQAMATIGIALIAMGEEVGAEMALRQFQHLMTYGEREIRTAVPLALGLISASNPQLAILDTLSKYSHDSDLDVALNSIFAMGLVGAGTNNARLAQMLRQLAVYYAKEPDCFFMVRIAQGLVHMGKGTIGLNPFFHDGQIMSRPAMAGLLSTLMALVEPRNFILRDSHWMLYWLSTAMFPQFLITLDEQSEEKAVTVRVGQAVNTVGLAGTRMGISGFQTHQTPVRVATGERAELGTNEYFPYQSVLEGLVILKKNEGYDAEDQ